MIIRWNFLNFYLTFPEVTLEIDAIHSYLEEFHVLN